jgi:hypothetical protein
LVQVARTFETRTRDGIWYRCHQNYFGTDFEGMIQYDARIKSPWKKPWTRRYEQMNKKKKRPMKGVEVVDECFDAQQASY